MVRGVIVALTVLAFIGLLAAAALIYFFILPGLFPGKEAVALEGGSPRGLIPEQVGDFELKGVDDLPNSNAVGAVEILEANYVGPDGVSLVHRLSTMPSPEAAEGFQRFSAGGTTGGEFGMEVVNERPVEAAGEEVGTVTVIQSVEAEGSTSMAAWNNGDLFAVATIEGEDISENTELVESFYENVPY